MLLLWIYLAGCAATLLHSIIALIIEHKLYQRSKERYEFEYGMILVVAMFVIVSWIGTIFIISNNSKDTYNYLTKK